MNFNLKKPCKDCPFRGDVDGQRGWLGEARAEGIIHALYVQDGTFSCHKTTHNRMSKQEHCAGAMILMERSGTANQLMRSMERVGAYDRDELLMDSPVFDTPKQFIEWNKGEHVVTEYAQRQLNGESFVSEKELSEESKLWLEQKNKEMREFIKSLDLKVQNEYSNYFDDEDYFEDA